MSAPEDNKKPGLTPELYDLDPVWFKRAFAYRLFCMLAPPAITRRLQRFLIDAAVFPGIYLPPGFVLPPGYTFPPGYAFPPGWKYGDPFPWGTWPPDFNWDDPPPGSLCPTPHLGFFGPLPNKAHGPVPLVHGTYVVYADSSDGHVYFRSGSWPSCHGASSGTYIDTTSSRVSYAVCSHLRYDGDFAISRSFFRFDLSALPKQTPSVVKLHILPYYYYGSSVSVQQSTHNIPLSLSDYSAFTGSKFSSLVWDNDFKVFDFNSAGINYIKSVLGSYAKLCLREYDHDYPDIAIPSQETNNNGCCFSEINDLPEQPYLTVVF